MKELIKPVLEQNEEELKLAQALCEGQSGGTNNCVFGSGRGSLEENDDIIF